jgi:Carboxypeptidase regulatory-like domain
MRRKISAIFLSTILSAPAALAQNTTAPDSQYASVAGVITNSVTGEPVLRAHIQFLRGREVWGAMSNAEGKFSITKMPPGEYSIVAERIGFVMKVTDRSNEIELGPGEKKDALKLQLTPLGAISGRVLDAEGEPVQNAMVTADGPNDMVATALTDDKGAYRLGGLHPGRYRVKAAPQSLPLPPEVRSDGTTEAHYSPTFYPSVLEPASATRVDVRPAAQVQGTDIRLVRTAAVKVSGTVSGIPEGAKGVSIQMQRPAEFGQGWSSSSGANTDAAGNFTLWQVDPGKITLVASLYSSGAPLQSAPVDLEVTSSNIEHVALRMVPAFAVSGEVRFDDAGAHTDERRIMIQSDGGMGASAQGEVRPDESFHLEKVEPGLYHAQIFGGAGDPVYVRSVRVGTTETEGDVLDLRNGPAGPVTLNVSSKTGEISGMATNSKGPMAQAPVALVPESGGHQEFLTTSTDREGKYSFDHIPPGKYRVVVMDENFPASARNGYGLEDYADVMASVELHPGDHVTRDLKARIAK